MIENSSSRERGKPLGVIEWAQWLAYIDGRAGRIHEADIRQAKFIVAIPQHRNENRAIGVTRG